jgi:predicted metal-dependent HD superfamily phosphohydrolase
VHSATGRVYHNLDHLTHCLAEFDSVRAQAADPVIAELALWFHDLSLSGTSMTI